MLSNTCKYGIRAVVYLAGNTNEEDKIGIRKISKELDIPAPFLSKILQQLVKQGLLLSSKGPHGGFSLSRKPNTIGLLDIVRAIDGNDVFTDCVMQAKKCKCADKEKAPCPLHYEYSDFRNNMIGMFNRKNIEDLVINARDSDEIRI